MNAGLILTPKGTVIFCAILILFVLTLPKLLSISKQTETQILMHFIPRAANSTPSPLIPQPPPTLDDSIHVLLLAKHRTGSSLTGELLSLHPKSTYFFEPDRYPRKVQNDKSSEGNINFLEGLFNCNSTLMQDLNRKIPISTIRKLNGIKTQKRHGLEKSYLNDKCRSSKVRVAKTILIKVKDIRLFINQGFKPTFKIVHLVRDPRAMLTSMGNTKYWKKEDKTAKTNCYDLTQEMQIGNLLPNDTYMRVKYEDVVENTEETVNKVYNFIGINLDKDILRDYMKTHMQSNSAPKEKKPFSTIRNSNFDANHWINTATEEFAKDFDKYCDWMFDQLGYTKYKQLKKNKRG